MHLFFSRPLASLAIVTLVVAVAPPGRANINLELRPVTDPCVSACVEVDLYAVSDNQDNQSMAAMDVILSWDPAALNLLGVDANIDPPYQWLFSGFLDDHLADGLNNTWADGNALYEALGQLGVPAYATPPGLQVTRFRFEKLELGLPTTVSMLPSYGQHSHTVVYDGVVPGRNVTGTLTALTLTPSTKGDLDCDGTVDFDDIDPFILALSDPATYQIVYPNCNIMNGDLNCDNRVDFDDINPFVALLSSGATCP